MKIADRILGEGHPPFIAGEVGVNHGGSLARALRMVHIAKEAGCDACKFGTFKASEFCAPEDPLFEMFKSCELPDSAWATIKAECDKAEIIFFSTPQNRSDLDVLLRVGVPAVKVGSDDLTNLTLIADYAKTGLPIILSTGMADAWEISIAAHIVVDNGNPLAVCVCTSEYPCPPEHANLSRIDTLREFMPGVIIGFSDHTESPLTGAVAAGLGAHYFEKHFTLDNRLPGPDHAFSADPQTLSRWVANIREAHRMRGDGGIKPTADEYENRKKWRRRSGQQIRGVTA